MKGERAWCVSCTRTGKHSSKIKVLLGASHSILSSIPRSDRTSKHIRDLAHKYPRSKFVSIVGDKCIADLPDSRVPMIIVYRKGEIRNQIIAWGADRDRSQEG